MRIVTGVRAGALVRNGRWRRARGWVLRPGVFYGAFRSLVYRPLDRLVFAWWWYGQGEEGAYRWRWYRRLEDAWSQLYARVYLALWYVILKEIGE